MDLSFGIALLEATAPAGEPGGLGSMIPSFLLMGGVIVLMYFLMIRPQRKKEKAATEMRNSLEIGDEITTIGGIVGRVVSLKEDNFVIETASERTRMRFKRWAIQDVNKLSLDATADSSSSVKDTADKASKSKDKKSDK